MCRCHQPTRTHQSHRPAVSRRRMLGLLAGVAAAPMLAACSEDGSFPLQLVPEEQIQQMGLQTWEQIRQQERPSGNRTYQQVLDRVSARLLQASGENPQEWEAVVFQGDEINAFALPGKKIGVYEGMFRAAENEDQLAAVVGHEIGHVTADHSQQRVNADAATQLGVDLAGLLLGSAGYSPELASLLGVGAQYGLVLPYSRRQELEADRLGLVTMARAGFDPNAAVSLWENMQRLGGGGPPTFLSTHPAPEDRIARIREMIPEAQAAAG